MKKGTVVAIILVTAAVSVLLKVEFTDLKKNEAQNKLEKAQAEINSKWQEQKKDGPIDIMNIVSINPAEEAAKAVSRNDFRFLSDYCVTKEQAEFNGMAREFAVKYNQVILKAIDNKAVLMPSKKVKRAGVIAGH